MPAKAAGTYKATKANLTATRSKIKSWRCDIMAKCWFGWRVWCWTTWRAMVCERRKGCWWVTLKYRYRKNPIYLAAKVIANNFWANINCSSTEGPTTTIGQSGYRWEMGINGHRWQSTKIRWLSGQMAANLFRIYTLSRCLPRWIRENERCCGRSG